MGHVRAFGVENGGNPSSNCRAPLDEVPKSALVRVRVFKVTAEEPNREILALNSSASSAFWSEASK